MIQLYTETNTDYAHNGDVTLEPMSCTLDLELNGAWELTMECPLDAAEKYKFIQINAVLSVPAPDGSTQLYRIYDTEKTDSDVLAYARPIFLDAAKEVFFADCRPTDLSGQEALDYLMSGTKYSGTTDITLTNTAYYVRKNLIEALAGTDDTAFLNRWGGEILYDNYNVDIRVKQGEDRGLRVEFGRNIQSITESIDTESMVTRAIPVSFNGYTLDGDEPWVDSPRINDYPIVYAKKVEMSTMGLAEDVDSESSTITTYETLDELRDAMTKAVETLYEEGLDLPTTTYTIDMVDLSAMDEYKDFKGLETIQLGDTVHCYHRKLGIETEARAIEIQYDCIAKAITKVTLGDYESDYWSNLTNVTTSAVTQADFDQVATQITYIQSNYIKTNELEAQIADIGYLTAEQIEALYATFGDLEAAKAEINELLAGYASIEYLEANFLTADSAYIVDLSATIANITSLLSGNIGTGILESIHLTADNAVIDDAVILNALMGYASIEQLLAGTIYTDYIKIANNENENLWIDGSTIQITDENGIVRVQIGEDGEGDYNLYLWNAAGTLIWNALGLTEEGLTGNGAIIKDDAVADDAAISGYKLDIQSVASALNEDGSLQMSASQVLIDGSTLDVWYADVIERFDGLESIDWEGVVGVEVWYAVGESYIVPPSNPDGSIIPSIVDEAETGISRVDYTDYEISADWTTERLIAGDDEYLWIALCLSHSNGEISWVGPWCATDHIVRESVDTLQTEFSVIQGQIQAIVSETQIEELLGSGTTLYDLYSTLTMELGQIEIAVGSLETSIFGGEEESTESLYSQLSALTITLDSITEQVSALQAFTGEDGSEGLLSRIADLEVQSTGISSLVEECLTETVTVTNEDGTEEEVTQYTTVERLRTELQQYADAVSITISSTLESLQGTAESLSQAIEQYETYFSFTTDGLLIAQSDSPFSALFGPEELDFLESGNVVTYISNSVFHMIDAEVENTLTVGVFQFIPARTSKLYLLNLNWVGGK